MKKNICCSFCGRDKQETLVLVSGANGYICEICVLNAQVIVNNEMADKLPADHAHPPLPKPADIKKKLDEYVIGQEESKKILSVAVYNHYKRIFQPGGKKDDVEIEKSNIVMAGDTGTGKTLLARTLARVLNVPFCIADATVITEAGYVGEDVESVLSRLLQAANFNERATERGIVFIDEIDKIARKGDNPSITRDVSGEGVQQGLLKLMEGSIVHVPPQGGRKHPEQKLIPIDTTNILFICGGAFDGLSKIIGRRLNTQIIGFKKGDIESIDKENLLQYITPQDIRTFGLIPELVGRMPVVTFLHPLDKASLRRILTEPKNALVKQYVRLFEMDGVALTIDDNALDYIVDKAIEFKLGARGLRSICEAIMTDAMFEIPSKTTERRFTITLHYAQEKLDRTTMRRLKVA